MPVALKILKSNLATCKAIFQVSEAFVIFSFLTHLMLNWKESAPSCWLYLFPMSLSNEIIMAKYRFSLQTGVSSCYCKGKVNYYMLIVWPTSIKNITFTYRREMVFILSPKFSMLKECVRFPLSDWRYLSLHIFTLHTGYQRPWAFWYKVLPAPLWSSSGKHGSNHKRKKVKFCICFIYRINANHIGSAIS